MLQSPLSTSEVAAKFGCDSATVLRMIADGRLMPAGKLPGRTGAYLFDRVEIDRLVGESASKVVIPKAAS